MLELETALGTGDATRGMPAKVDAKDAVPVARWPDGTGPAMPSVPVASSRGPDCIAAGGYPDSRKRHTCTGERMANRMARFRTNLGEFQIELFEDKAPITTKNFIDLAEKKYFDGVVFHRVIDKFMIQGGDPTGTGRGGPGYTIKDEFHKDLKHTDEGMLSMANAGPNTGGSQFFVTLAATPWLDGKHAIFGKVVSGMDVVRTIGKSKTDARDRPVEPVTIEQLTIEAA
jgi:peptidyl-prolyl cis-trans isomerase A (cyclophilin A)